MLDTYIARTQQLLQLPQAPVALYAEEDLTSWINIARGQLAGEGECIRRIGDISTSVDERVYNFSDIDLGVAATTGIAAAINIRRINYTVGTGQKQITPRGWEWFDLYHLSLVVPRTGPPEVWAQYGQGAAPGSGPTGPGGSFYLDPVPDNEYELFPDCVCWPIELADDSTAEAIPYLWTDAVPYYAAYLALMSAQSNARVADAERLFNQYDMFVKRARQFSNPSLLRPQYAQSVDPAQINKLSVRPPSQGAG